MEAKNNFAEASTSRSQEKPIGNSEVKDVNPSLLATFLKTCMKLLRDQKTVEGIKELIKNYVGKIKIPTEQHNMRKLGKHKKKNRHEMRLTTQIREYEIDQIILDLGSDANVLPKKT